MIFEVPRVYGGRVDWKLLCSLCEMVPEKSHTDVLGNLNFLDKELRNAQASMLPAIFRFLFALLLKLLYLHMHALNK